MNYEKSYKEALERAKSKIENDKGHVLYEDDIVAIFPELAESEDERIRKACIKYLDWEYTHCSRGEDKMKIEKCVSWLEKQGEHTKFMESIQIGDKITKTESGNLVNLSQLERIAKPRKQNPTDNVEQKPSWNEDDEKNLNTIINVIHGGTHLAYENEIDWLKSLKYRIE